MCLYFLAMSHDGDGRHLSECQREVMERQTDAAGALTRESERKATFSVLGGPVL